jgi:hypothetical protein
MRLSLNLVRYDLPPYVQVAKQAGIFGEVRSKIISDAQTNLAKSVQLVSGHLMLGHPAVDVAKNGVAHTGGWLKSVVQGYFNYHAVPGNLDSLAVFRDRILGLWWRTLRRRSQRRRFSWTRMLTLGRRWLPQPRLLHPYPADRFASSHPR